MNGIGPSTDRITCCYNVKGGLGLKNEAVRNIVRVGISSSITIRHG